MLVGAIIATEFAMAQAYPDEDFVHNAPVFAPGKTILESLRELMGQCGARAVPISVSKVAAIDDASGASLAHAVARTSRPPRRRHFAPDASGEPPCAEWIHCNDPSANLTRVIRRM